MRLIDADAYLERVKQDPLFDLVERYGFSRVLAHEPTVEAIPIKWIEDYMERLDSVGFMLNNWRHDNEVD